MKCLLVCTYKTVQEQRVEKCTVCVMKKTPVCLFRGPFPAPRGNLDLKTPVGHLPTVGDKLP